MNLRSRLPFLAIPLLLISLSACARAPHIDAITPRIGNMGELLTIEGRGFGATRGENYVSVAGIQPTASSYTNWTDTRIVVRLPDFGESGLVYVHADSRRSNPALFSNRSVMPRPVVASQDGNAPRILSIEPPEASIGSVITISGRNFGHTRGEGAVLFAWESEVPPSAPSALKAPDYLEAGDLEFSYEQWTDREIRVRVPDGAISGNIAIRVAQANSNPTFFAVSGRPGTKIFKDKRSYAISYSVNVRDVKASGPNMLYIWMPQPVSSSAQKRPQLMSRSIEPFVSSQRSPALLFQLRNLNSSNNQTIELSWVVDVNVVETQVRSQAIPKAADSPLRSAYTQASTLLPADNAKIRQLAAEIAGKEKNSYLRARRVWDWILANIAIHPNSSARQALVALESRAGNAAGASLLYCSLLRALDIPAVPCSGFLVGVSRSQQIHWWAEFWVDGFGWVPVDPAMAQLAGTDRYPAKADAREYYFGNLDNQRICFSRGQTLLSKMDPRGRVVAREQGYALQTIWEESTGGLDAYSTLWSDLTITGVY